MEVQQSRGKKTFIQTGRRGGDQQPGKEGAWQGQLVDHVGDPAFVRREAGRNNGDSETDQETQGFSVGN